MKAAVWGHTKVVKVLVEAGADLTKANRDGTLQGRFLSSFKIVL